MKRRGKATDLSSALSALSGTLNRQSKGAFLQARVAAEWDRIAGPRVAEHTTEVYLRSGELSVKVDSPVWATELSALAGPYAQAMNEALGKDWVESVRFTVSRRVQERRKIKAAEQEKEAFYRPEEVPSAPLTEEELAAVEASVPDVGDEQLRQAVIRATVAGLEWEKGRRRAKSAQNPSQGL